MDKMLMSADEINSGMTPAQVKAIDNYLSIREIMETGAWKEISTRFSDYLETNLGVDRISPHLYYIPVGEVEDYLDVRTDHGIIARHYSAKVPGENPTETMHFVLCRMNEEEPWLIDVPINIRCKCGMLGIVDLAPKGWYACNINGFDLIDLTKGVPDHLQTKQVLFEMSHIVDDMTLVNILFYSDEIELEDGCWEHYNMYRVLDPWDYKHCDFTLADVINEVPAWSQFFDKEIKNADFEGEISDTVNAAGVVDLTSHYSPEELDREKENILFGAITVEDSTEFGKKLLTVFGSHKKIYDSCPDKDGIILSNLQVRIELHRSLNPNTKFFITPMNHYDPVEVDPENLPEELKMCYCPFYVGFGNFFDTCERAIFFYHTLKIDMGPEPLTNPRIGPSTNERAKREEMQSKYPRSISTKQSAFAPTCEQE